jgi:hypothetical protein
MENKDDKGSSLSLTEFFEANEMYAPRDMKKLGYRLKKGMPYRPYSMTEIKKLIAEGKIVPIAPKPIQPDVEQVDDHIKAQLALYGVAKRNPAVRRFLKGHTITLSWDEARNRPALEINPPFDMGRKYSTK